MLVLKATGNNWGKVMLVVGLLVGLMMRAGKRIKRIAEFGWKINCRSLQCKGASRNIQGTGSLPRSNRDTDVAAEATDV